MPIEEWRFSQLEANQLTICRDYEMGREVLRLERLYRQQPAAKQWGDLVGLTRSASASAEGSPIWVASTVSRQQPEAKPFGDSEWLESRVQIIRKAWGINGFTSSVRGNPSWFIFPASRVLVLYPEWPDMPYLKINRNDRSRRLQEQLTHATNNERLANLEYLLEPSNQATGTKCIREIAIPECLTHEELSKAFNAWLKVNFAEQGKSGMEKHGKSVESRRQGRGSEKAAVADDLNALAAHRLCNTHRLPRSNVIELIKRPKTGKNPGAPVYSTEKQLDKPLNRILRRIHDFREKTMADLEPLEPLNLSQPDFTSLFQM